VVPDALLLLIERLLRLLELDFEEGGRGVRLALALLRVADDVEARERVGDVGGLLRILPAIADGERHRRGLAVDGAALHLLVELDVLPQTLDGITHAAAPADLGIQI